MNEKMGINIYDFNNFEDKNLIEELFDKRIQLGNLTPIIGNGFTGGLRTSDGAIPSVSCLIDELVTILSKITDINKEEYKDASLTDLSDLFWEMISKKENKKFQNQFQDFIETNFTKSCDIEQPKRDFLNSDWSTIFTLNYDDSIENVLDINVIIPYDSISFSNRKKYLIKLHGDAKKYVLTGDKKFCILGNQQYANLIKDKENEDVLNALADAFYSKDIIFVGCGLDNELDILYSVDTQLYQKLKIDKEHRVIYLLYNDDGKEVQFIKYKKYAITDLVIVDRYTIVDFYEMIYNLSSKNKKLRDDDILKDYTDIKFEYLDDKNMDNIGYLFFNNKVNIYNGIIKLPSFFINRTRGDEIIRHLENKSEVLHIVYGSNLSGKTYLLIQLLNYFNHRKVYYFPSNKPLDDELLNKLIEKDEVIILIDEGVVSFEQYTNILLTSLDKIKEKRIKIVMNINKSDSEFYKNFSINKDVYENRILLHPLENKFDKTESQNFNDKIGILSLVPYNDNNTILDYLYRAESSILSRKQKPILPRVHFLNRNEEEKVRALIVLATKGAITSKEAIEVGVDSSLYILASEFSITIQKDYMSEMERIGNLQSGFKFILNSSYWAIKCLSNFASNQHNHATIVKAYHNIISSYEGLNVNVFNNKAKIYYMLDKIQMLFSDNSNKGMLRLPNSIYEELHSSLSKNFHFLHQEAKCKLRVARRESNNDNKQKILEKAYTNIERALSLTDKVTSKKIEYTIAHMLVTKALILTNYIFSGNEYMIDETIDIYYDVFGKYKDLIPQLKNDEIKDFNMFFGKMWELSLEGQSKNKFDELYTNYQNMDLKHFEKLL